MSLPRLYPRLYSEDWFTTQPVSTFLAPSYVGPQVQSTAKIHFVKRTRNNSTELNDLAPGARIPSLAAIIDISRETEKIELVKGGSMGIIVTFGAGQDERWSLRRLRDAREYYVASAKLVGWKKLQRSGWIEENELEQLLTLDINATLKNSSAISTSFAQLGRDLASGVNQWIGGDVLDVHTALLVPHLNAREGVRPIIIVPSAFHQHVRADHQGDASRAELARRTEEGRTGSGWSGGRELSKALLQIREMAFTVSETGERPLFAFFVNKRTVHWASIVVDLDAGTLSQADSLRWGEDDSGELALLSLYSSFFGVQLVDGPDINLDEQIDSGSCGLAAASAIERCADAQAVLWTAGTAAEYRRSWLDAIIKAQFGPPLGDDSVGIFSRYHTI